MRETKSVSATLKSASATLKSALVTLFHASVTLKMAQPFDLQGESAEYYTTILLELYRAPRLRLEAHAAFRR